MSYNLFTADSLDNPIDAQLLAFEGSIAAYATVTGWQVYQIAGQDRPEATNQLASDKGSDHDVATYFEQNPPTEANPLGVGVFIEYRDGGGETQQAGPLSFADALSKAQGI